MAFALSGSTITHTGTSTSLAGLTGIAGVTTITLGSMTIYRLSAVSLVVGGSLTFDCNAERIIIDGVASGALSVAGSLTLNSVKTAGGVTYPTKRLGISISGGGSGYSGIITGTVTLNGAVIEVSSNYYLGLFINGGTLVTTNDAKIFQAGAVGVSQLYFLNATYNISGLTADGLLVTFDGASGTLSGLAPSDRGVQVLNRNAVVFTDFAPETPAAAIYNYNNSYLTCVGSKYGTASVYSHNNGAMSIPQYIGLGRSIQFSMQLASGAVPAAAYVRINDVNNGSRVDVPYVSGQSGDNIYLLPLTSGVSSTQTVWVAHYRATGSSGSRVNAVDYRTKSGAAGNDKLDAVAYAYNSAITQVEINLMGTGVLNTQVLALDDPYVTKTASATAALTTIADRYDLYDALKYWKVTAGYTYPTATTLPMVSSAATLNITDHNLVVDAAASAAFAINTGTKTVTIKSSSFNAVGIVTTGLVSSAGGATITGVYSDSAGTHVTISAPSLPSGARVQIYNATDSAEIYNGTLSGAGLSLPVTWTADKTIRLRATKIGKLPLEATGVLSSSGLTFLSTMADDAVYTANAVDGSAVTEFAPDPPNLQVDITDGDGLTTPQRLYAWMQHYLTTSAGVASGFFGGLTAADTANYAIDPARVDLKLDNQSASPVLIVGGYLYRTDGTTVIAATSGSIQMDPGRAYTAPGSAAITVPAGERVITMQPGGGWVAHG